MRRWIVPIVVMLGLALGVIAHRYSPPDPQVVDGVEPSGLDRALETSPDRELSASKTSVVLAIVCTLRKNRLQPYGHAQPTSPFLQSLSTSGLTLDHHYTQAPWTRPSMGSLLTSRWPRALHLDNPGPRGSLNLVLDESHTTLAERLASVAYQTIGSTGNPNLNRQFGLAQGFGEYSEPASTYKGKKIVEVDGRDQVDFLVDALGKSNPDQPVFLQIVLTDAHTPRQVETRYLRLFAAGPSAWRKRRVRYDASVRKVDAVLARLFSEVREQRPNSLFVVASDHGEGLRVPEHHGKGHGNFLYETHIGSPSIWQHPGMSSPGRHFKHLSMNLDVVPTILDLLGIEPVGVMDGRSLAPWMRNQDDRPVHDVVFAETFYGRSNKRVVISPTHQFHLNVKPRRGGPSRERLYASEDWKASEDLLAALPLVGQSLRVRLQDWETQMEALLVNAEKPKEVVLDDDMRSQLEALGYVE